MRQSRGGPCGRMRCPSWRLCSLASAAFDWDRLPVCCEGRATCPAELGGGPHLLATARAGPHEHGPAFLAELHSLGILTPTTGAAHRASLLLPLSQSKQNTSSPWVR